MGDVVDAPSMKTSSSVQTCLYCSSLQNR